METATGSWANCVLAGAVTACTVPRTVPKPPNRLISRKQKHAAGEQRHQRDDQEQRVDRRLRLAGRAADGAIVKSG